MLHFFGIFFNTAKLLDGEFCHMFFIISDFLDEHIKIFNASPVLNDSFCLIGFEIFQSVDVIR